MRADKGVDVAQLHDRRLVGIAVGTPGPLELPAGILRKPPDLKGWDGFNLKAAIETNLGLEIALENDANLGEEQRLELATAIASPICVSSPLVQASGMG